MDMIPRKTFSNGNLTYHITLTHDTEAVKGDSQPPLSRSTPSFAPLIIKCIAEEKEKQRAKLWPEALLYAFDNFVPSMDSKD